MYALDFEYDGRYLSDFNFLICTFNGPTDTEIVTAGSKITFNTVPLNRGKINYSVGTKYDECIQLTFQICKNPELFEDMRITTNEFRNLMRWLNREEFLKFRIIDEDASADDLCYYNGSFNVEKINVSEVLYGLSLTLITNSPFGFGAESINKWSVTSPGQVCSLGNSSDYIGFLYPDVKIVCKESGDLTIKNDLGDCWTEIKNCKAGEVITLYGDVQIINSSLPSHKIHNDFNFEFLRIGSTYSNRTNNISVSLPCDLEIRYTPIIKNTPV